MQILQELCEEVRRSLENWDVKGIIDVNGTIYVVSQDTKLLSKVFELYLSPVILAFAKRHNLEVLPASAQNQYPDFSLRGEALGLSDGTKWVALDVKSAYKTGEGRDGDEKFSGFTLGTYRGYMRDQNSTQYSTLPYKDYAEHWCLCIIYSREDNITEERSYSIEQLEQIPLVIKEIEVYLQEKYKIAWYTPGSGNTANIGSVKKIKDVYKGTGPFAEHGEKIFEDYWVNYLRKEDAERIGLKKPPYSNLEEYLKLQSKSK